MLNRGFHEEMLMTMEKTHNPCKKADENIYNCMCESVNKDKLEKTPK